MAQVFNTYVDKNSYMHRLNPSLKLIALVIFIVMIFLPLGFFGNIILLFITLILWIITKLSSRAMWSIIKSCLVMFIILLLINWITYKSPGFLVFSNQHIICNTGGWLPWAQNPEITWTHGFIWGGQVNTNMYQAEWVKSLNNGNGGWIFPSTPDGWKDINFQIGDTMYYLPYKSAWYGLSSQALILAASITLKIFLMIAIITIIISSTNPVQLSFAIEDILNPLRYIKIPVNEWAMTISIALRFVPSLMIESQVIMKAQASRGVDFKNGNFKDKMKALVSLVVPMFSIAFHKADDLANAMEARAYNPRYARTRYRNYLIHWTDWILFFLLVTLLGIYIIFSAKHILFGPFGFVDATLLFGAN